MVYRFTVEMTSPHIGRHVHTFEFKTLREAKAARRDAIRQWGWASKIFEYITF
jgi:hypothetical protein